MRIGIDARFYGSLGKGLGRYTHKLIENLEKVDDENRYFIFLRKENFAEYNPRNANFQKVLADCCWYTFAEQLNMPRILAKYDLDLVHFPHFNVPVFYRKNFIITIHDLILLHFPTTRGTTLNSLFYWLKFLAYKFTINSAIKRSKKILAVSSFTKEDILANYGVPENKIAVTYEACDDFCSFSVQDNREILKKYGIIKPYVMYVGNAYPHKNLEKLVSAFARIGEVRKNLCLVLVGKEDYFHQRLARLVKKKNIKNVIFAGFVPDGDLDGLYRNASLYVFPSLYEGFGLPPLEAMAKGTPVVSSDHPCMKEVLGESAYYFNAKKEEKIVKAVLLVLGDEKLREELRKKGYEQIKKYSWKKMAVETLKIYKNCLIEKQ